MAPRPTDVRAGVLHRRVAGVLALARVEPVDQPPDAVDVAPGAAGLVARHRPRRGLLALDRGAEARDLRSRASAAPGAAAASTATTPASLASRLIAHAPGT
jgi:hypothetical protein